MSGDLNEEKKEKEGDSQQDPQQNLGNSIEILNKKIAELETLTKDYLSGWKRTKADFVNYKKDEEKRAADVFKFVKINFFKKLLSILDSLEEAKKQESLEIEALSVQIKQIFKSEGLEEIEALGKIFNPNFHESAGVVESGGEEGVVAEELRKGYTVEGVVIRPSLVKITAH